MTWQYSYIINWCFQTFDFVIQIERQIWAVYIALFEEGCSFVYSTITCAVCRCRWGFSDRWLLWEGGGGFTEAPEGWWGEMLCLVSIEPTTHAPSAASAPTPASFVMLIKATGTVFCSSQREREQPGRDGHAPRDLKPPSLLFFNVTRCAQQKPATIHWVLHNATRTSHR